MPKATVKIYDKDNNVVDELPYGQGGITGTEVNGQRQQVYQDIDKQGNKIYLAAEGFKDPFMRIGKEIENTISIQAPKVQVIDNKVTVQAPKEILSSPIVAQMKQELQSLKGADLSNPEVQRAIDALNEEVKNSVENMMLQASTGWTRDQYNDYQYARQSVMGTNPMRSTNKIKGKDKDGIVISKTPQEWIDYYRQAYSTDERNNKFQESLQSSDPYERTMALVMSQGEVNPIYGFDTGERIGQGVGAAWNQVSKLWENWAKDTITSTDSQWAQDLAKERGVSLEEFSKLDFENTEQLKERIDSMKSTPYKNLSDEDKALSIALSTSRKNVKDLSDEDLKDIKTHIDNIKRSVDYQTDLDRNDVQLAKNANWSGNEQVIGNFAGVVARFLLENAIGKAATGIPMNAISDKIGARIVNGLANKGWSPTSTFGKSALQFAANLVGTIPEDILQTAVDNVITGTPEENANLFSPEEMSQNFRNNLIFMALFNAGKAGFNAVRRGKIAKDLAKQAELGTVLDIEGINSDVDDIVRATKKGNQINVTDDTVSIVDDAGKEKVLNNITPEQGRMAQQNLTDTSTDNYSRIGIAEQRNALSSIPPELQNAWYEVGDRTARDAIADIIESNPSIRNASLNKLYEDYLYWQKAMDHTPLSFDDWLNSDIVLYRYSNPEMDSGLKTLSYSVAPGGLPIMGGDVQVIVVRPIDTLGKAQLTGTAAENEVFVRSNVANSNSPREGTYEFAVVKDNILNNKDATNTAAKRAMTTREIDVWSSKKMKEGDRVYTSSSEADAEFGHGNVAKHTIKLSDAEWDDVNHGRYKTSIGGSNADGQPTVRVEVDTPEGKINVETPDYRIRNLDDSLKLKIEPTPASVKHLHNKTLQVLMDSFQQKHLPDFQRRFPGVEASDFDWVFHNTRNGLEPNQIIGTVNPETGREVTEQMIKAMEWFGDQPFMKDLRKASRDALGLEGDFNMLGYLPHSTYDPSNLSFDEALTGQLWRQYSGASMTGENGEYKGFGGDFNSRYRTFASNMLWDARSKDVAAAKLMEEAAMDGKTITSEQAVRAVEGQQDIQRKVSEAASTKELETALASDTDADEIDFKKIDEATKKQAQNSGLSKAIHDNYAEVYYGANSATVAKQSGATRQAFDTLGNTMRNTQIIDGRGRRMSLYDWGGADFVYAERNAVEIVNRYMREGGDLRDMLIEFIENHSHRTTEYAEAVADRWMKKLGDTPGQLTKAGAIRSLSGSMKWEAMGRIRKFLTMAKYDEFNDATKKTIDSFLFSHMQLDTIKTSQKIGKKLSGALNAITSMRYRALFYGNVKNALLQTSELNRLFTTFKWGDVATMARRMTTDANFKARVDDIYDAVAPQQSSFRDALYKDYAEVAGNMETTQKGVSFKEGGKKMVEAVDNIGLAPIEAAESFKNRMMVAALVQEADSLGLTGDDALRHIRNRFERVALAMDELGRIGLTSNPIARTALFLQNFQIRELGMHIYNLSDEWAKGTKLPKKVLNASKYLSKVLGTKMATTLIMARLGYSASQTLGYDPFGVLENYTGMDEEDMEGFDYFMKSPLFAGGMTSLLSDMYFMSRKAYEESNPKTVSEEAEEEISGESSWGMAGLSFDELMGLGQSFVPGNVFFNRINQMNEMMDTGWATSQSGNKMYTAPTDALNTILGYLFGRSATQNAQQYNQTYGDNLWQTLGRMRPGRDFNEFDPIDSKNYSDWFKGDANDLQQFNKGLRYFRSERDRIIDAYEEAIRRGYSTDEDAEAKNNMNQQLDELYDKLDRFVDAYESKNGTIDANMTKQIVNVLNTGRKVLSDTEQEAEQRSLQAYNDALGRYSQQGFSPVGTYTGPTESDPSKEIKYQGSPQYRSAIQGYYGSGEEAVNVLKEADKQLQSIRKELKQQLSNAYDVKDYDRVNQLQRQYLAEFDQVVSPIIAAYGNSILKDTDVVNQIKDMLSTGTMSRSGDLIPTSQYKKDKYGRYRSMPLETVDVKKWAQQRFGGELYTQPTINSGTTAEDDIIEIKQLISTGRPQRARARALQLKVRVDNQTRSLSPSDYQWLNDFLNGEQ